ncbi:leucine-rich repeat-containing protein 74A-like [Saccostrea echinata]|uniref:leucine-rich repeat-containing protein 74A-like n=1 Tax=Saccostrea echinata TaxID=191078 RepID=UPI002A838CBE|nr:leucine-rich repeat-containing protein 74A-like [Saccostrea echinata]
MSVSKSISPKVAEVNDSNDLRISELYNEEKNQVSDFEDGDEKGEMHKEQNHDINETENRTAQLLGETDFQTVLEELEKIKNEQGEENKITESYTCSNSDESDEANENIVMKNEEDRNDSDFYDTDLEDGPFKTDSSQTELRQQLLLILLIENDFGESDYLICRQRYIEACSKYGHVPPQKRILQELEKKTLSVAYRCLSARDIKPLCVALVDNLRVQNLNLSHCDIRDEGCVYVAQLLTDNIVISRLNLSSNGLTYVSMNTLSHALAYNKILHHLDLSGNKLDYKAVYLLASGLAKNSTLLTINLSNNAFCEESGLTLGAALAENKRIQEIDLSWNQLRGRGTVGLLKALEINSTLTSINLAWNGLLYDGSVAVSKCLKSNTTLTSLDITHNNINWNGAWIISKGLAANKTLQVLKIGNNPLTTTGAMDLLLAVSSETSKVRVLDLIDVAVLGETELLAIMLMNKRKLQFIHGGVVRSSDVLGERKEREITAMEKVISYMKSVGLRPLELLRAFDKSAQINVSQKEFKNRLKKTGLPLFRYELESLAQTISTRSTGDSRGIDYKKLVEEVKRQILTERNRKIAERRKREKRREYHKRVLNVKLPVEVLSELEDEISQISRPQTAQSNVSNSTVSLRGSLERMNSKRSILSLPPKRTTSKRSVFSLPQIPYSQETQQTQTPPLQIKQIVPSKKPGPTLSMCAPLGVSSKSVKKSVRKKKRKSTTGKKHEDGHSWMSVNVPA